MYLQMCLQTQNSLHFQDCHHRLFSVNPCVAARHMSDWLKADRPETQLSSQISLSPVTWQALRLVMVIVVWLHVTVAARCCHGSIALFPGGRSHRPHTKLCGITMSRFAGSFGTKGSAGHHPPLHEHLRGETGYIFQGREGCPR